MDREKHKRILLIYNQILFLPHPADICTLSVCRQNLLPSYFLSYPQMLAMFTAWRQKEPVLYVISFVRNRFRVSELTGAGS